MTFKNHCHLYMILVKVHAQMRRKYALLSKSVILVHIYIGQEILLF